MTTNNPVLISTSKLLKDDINEWVKYVWNADKIEFITTFRKYGVNIDSESDLNILKELHSSGNDRSGFLRNIRNEQIVFNVLDTLKSINISKKQLVDSSVLFTK